MRILTLIATILVVVGGLNWGLIAINPDWNVVNLLFGAWPVVVRVVYAVVGVSALLVLVSLFTCPCPCPCNPREKEQEQL